VAAIGHKELERTGAFVVPGLAKFMVIKKPATKAPQGMTHLMVPVALIGVVSIVVTAFSADRRPDPPVHQRMPVKRS
jgi:hypothetical protein